jgi:hypothetical protein
MKTMSTKQMHKTKLERGECFSNVAGNGKTPRWIKTSWEAVRADIRRRTDEAPMPPLPKTTAEIRAEIMARMIARCPGGEYVDPRTAALEQSPTT